MFMQESIAPDPTRLYFASVHFLGENKAFCTVYNTQIGKPVIYCFQLQGGWLMRNNNRIWGIMGVTIESASVLSMNGNLIFE